MDSHPTFDLVQPMGRVEEMREDVSLYREQDKQNAVHDLSSWRVTIPRTGARPDPENFRKQYCVIIHPPCGCERRHLYHCSCEDDFFPDGD